MSTLPSRKRERSTVGFPKTSVKKTKKQTVADEKRAKKKLEQEAKKAEKKRKQEVMKTMEKPQGGTQANKDLYVETKVMLTPTQAEALDRWIDRSTGVKLTPSVDASKEVDLLLTKKQADAFKAGKSITLSQRTLRANVSGGFLPLIMTALENPITAGLIAAAARPIAAAIGEQLSKGVRKLGDAVGLGIQRRQRRQRKK